MVQEREIPLKTNFVTTGEYHYGSDDEQFVRLYRPAETTTEGVLPLVVYYHGGGWVIANSSIGLPSRRGSAQSELLDTAEVNWFGYYYESRPSDAQDSRLNRVAVSLR